MNRQFASQKSLTFTESVIREMTRLCLALHGAECLNLAQGFPDFAAPAELKEAAVDAIRADFNQYATTWGAKVMRDAIADKTKHFRGMTVDPETEITVCCGVTEAMLSTALAVLDPGDEVIIFEPFYENYGPDSILSGAIPRVVTLRPPHWHFDEGELRAAFTPRTRAIIVNTPHNPTGKVYSRDELTLIARVCQEFDVVAITDEIYEHLVYRGEHISLATLPGMRERTVTINGLSKTYSVTGWRLAYAIAPPEITSAIRKVHDFVTVGAPHPLQVAAATALKFPDSYYAELLNGYRERRDFILEILQGAGFRVYPPDGAYYVMTDITGFGEDDVAFAHRLVRDIGLATVPGSSFYLNPAQGRRQIRFSFPRRWRRCAGRPTALPGSARLPDAPVYLACPNRCSVNRFELWNASVFVDEHGRYVEHQTGDSVLYRCTQCGSPALDLGEVPSAMHADREAAARVVEYTCPNCEAIFSAPAEQNPIVCPECGQTFVVAH